MAEMSIYLLRKTHIWRRCVTAFFIFQNAGSFEKAAPLSMIMHACETVIIPHEKLGSIQPSPNNLFRC